jgi:hypothetical protein
VGCIIKDWTWSGTTSKNFFVWACLIDQQRNEKNTLLIYDLPSLDKPPQKPLALDPLYDENQAIADCSVAGLSNFIVSLSNKEDTITIAPLKSKGSLKEFSIKGSAASHLHVNKQGSYVAYVSPHDDIVHLIHCVSGVEIATIQSYKTKRPYFFTQDGNNFVVNHSDQSSTIFSLQTPKTDVLTTIALKVLQYASRDGITLALDEEGWIAQALMKAEPPFDRYDEKDMHFTFNPQVRSEKLAWKNSTASLMALIKRILNTKIIRLPGSGVIDVGAIVIGGAIGLGTCFLLKALLADKVAQPPLPALPYQPAALNTTLLNPVSPLLTMQNNLSTFNTTRKVVIA